MIDQDPDRNHRLDDQGVEQGIEKEKDLAIEIEEAEKIIQKIQKMIT